MAVAISNLTFNYDEDGGSSSTTASITLTANRLGLLTVASRTGITANPNTPTITGWTKIDEQLFDSTSSSRRKVTLFRRLSASDSTGTHTIDFGGQAQTDVLWIIDEASGVDTSGTNGSGAVVQSAKAVNEAGSSSLTVTLGAFASTANATFGAFGWDGITSVPTVGSGFTLLKNQNDSVSDISSLTEWKATNDTSVDFSYSPDATLVGGIAIEIRAEVIMFDSASNSGYQATASTYNWAHVCTTGSNRYLVVGVSMLSLAQTVTGITYNSVAMTFLGSQNSVSGAARVELWGLIAPSTGSNSIAVTLSGAIASTACAVSFTGVHQTSPTEGFNSAQATNVGAADATVNVTTVATNDWVVDQVATDDTAITVGALQTSRNNVTGAGGSGADSTEPATTAGSYTMSWTNVAALATWSIAAIALRDVNASSLGGAVKSCYRTLMGTGF